MNKYTVKFEVSVVDLCNLKDKLDRFLWDLNEYQSECSPSDLVIEGPPCAGTCCVDEDEDGTHICDFEGHQFDETECVTCHIPAPVY